ncbi:hypothetical protein GPECTOR_1g896 [Gonium pectorale]|uniref:Uncharacterized protein n=1 Tax=Gonium pectorale TaxID=33097 RepID=A0A150H4L3_GONPE|nr:hypothetical protein GPECTOR_1g896 [Gonium pectorale]|eukprot:KXZ56991.1 hypothetical protein GPECTOR_1g896 [Gonium pectorale]
MTSLEREVAEKKAAFENLSAENQQLRARTHILEKVVSCRDEQLGMVQAFTERCRSSPDSRSCFGSGMNTVPTDAQQDMFREMKKEEVIPMYKAFLAEVSKYLLHCQYPCNDPNSPIVQQVTACVERMGHTMKHVVLLNEPLMRQLLSINLETMQPAVASEAHWDAVVASLQLTPDQRDDILAVYDLYRTLAEKVYEERKLLTAAMGVGCGMLGPDAGSFVSRNAMADEMELVEKLDANLAKEHSARTLLCCFFFGKLLAPPQFAKVAVYSYPYFPDSLSVARAVVRQPTGCARSGGSGTTSRGSGRHSH